MNQPACLALARQLIQKQSITPDDAGCQQLLGDRLRRLGFDLEYLQYGEVTNLWARFGTASPLLVLAGHTDVVPPGDVSDWTFPPFAAEVNQDMLYGRGAADMKSSLAAMIVALEQLFALRSFRPAGSIALLITSDEEGDAVDGTTRVVDWLINQGVKADYAIIGEPSSLLTTGDMIRIGRRGSLTGTLQLCGRQGHVAYPEQVTNPIHSLGRIINILSKHQWDQASGDFPATSFQLVSCHSDAGATNIVPGKAKACFNFRFGHQLTDSTLRQQVEQMVAMDCRDSGIDWTIDWTCSAQPFISAQGRLLQQATDVIQDICGFKPALSTGGGTSDGRFIIRLVDELIELGPMNATIHQCNERVALAELDTLTSIYRQLIATLVS